MVSVTGYPRNEVRTECCFVLLIPTPEQYRVPRVDLGLWTLECLLSSILVRPVRLPLKQGL